jgi:3-oxoacyl-[acyl-carrier protein] reductase
VTTKRIAIVGDASAFVGPDIARLLAARDHDLVVGDAPADLVAELEKSGATVEVVEGVRDMAKEGSADKLVHAALERFGRIDAAVAFTGRVIVGRFLKSSMDDLRAVMSGCIEGPYNFLRAVVPVMVEQGDGQVLVFTSAAGARPTPGAALYSAARAGANHLVRNVADEVVGKGVQVNAIGTNFMDFPEFLRANRVTDDESRKRVESMVPIGRLGTLEECAHFALPFIDGTSRFQTGLFIPYAGGWA